MLLPVATLQWLCAQLLPGFSLDSSSFLFLKKFIHLLERWNYKEEEAERHVPTAASPPRLL